MYDDVTIGTLGDAADVERLYVTLEELLKPASRPSVEVLTCRFHSGLAIVRGASAAGGEFIGGYVLYRLAPPAVDSIESATIVRGSGLGDHDLLRGEDPEQGSSYYLSTIAACPGAGRVLTRDLEYFLTVIGARRVYSRPSTTDGRRFLTRAGYAQVAPNSEIWRQSRG
jgi:hypothetical protein